MEKKEEGQMNEKEYLKEWRKAHRGIKLCLDCNQKAKDGSSRCQFHLDYQAELTRKYRANKRKAALKKIINGGIKNEL